MKYKAIFDVHDCRPGSRASFDLTYFNGRFVVVLNTAMMRALMGMNEAQGSKFNCMFTTMLTKEQQKLVDKALFLTRDEAVYSLAESLPLEGTVFLRMNPQMAFLLSGLLNDACGISFQFDTNWIGAEILRDLCLGSDKDVYVLGHRMADLMDNLQQRRAEWKAAGEDDDPPPKGYMPPKVKNGK